MERFWALRAPRILAGLLCGAVLCAAAVNPEFYQRHVEYLASPQMRGRGAGTPQLNQAAEYIAGHFRQWGLQTLNGEFFFQPFRLTKSARLGKYSTVVYQAQGKRQVRLKLERDFIPLNFTSNGRVSGPVVFAGFGITAPEYGYDDYAGLDARGKIVVVMRDEPQEYEGSSVFLGKAYTQHAQLFQKAVNARRHGAAALILVRDVAAHLGEPDELPAFNRYAGPSQVGIPVVQVRAGIVNEWLSLAGVSLEEIGHFIDRDLTPRSVMLPAHFSVQVAADVYRDEATAYNVAAYLPGQTGEYLVVGAHYDHIGLGEQFSLAPSKRGSVHPGADDNASGTAGLLELARYYAAQQKPKRGILFLAFAGEELGMLGSSHYVSHPLLPLEHAVAMINLDMIGRIREGKVYVSGFGTGKPFRPLLEELLGTSGLYLDFSEQSDYGSSDHVSFAARQVPTLFFFSGLHGDYHRPDDIPGKINAEGAVQLLGFVAEVVRRLLDASERPEYVRPAGVRPATDRAVYGLR